MTDPWVPKVTISSASPFLVSTNTNALAAAIKAPKFVPMEAQDDFLSDSQIQSEDDAYMAMREEIENLPREPWMFDLALATPVLFRHNLTRQQILKKAKWGTATWKIWKRGEVAMQQGYIMGMRNLADGRLDYDGDYGNQFCGMKYFPGYIVVTGLRSTPWHVLPQDIILPGGEIDPL